MSHILTVRQLNLYLAGLLEEDSFLGTVLVRGEISDCRSSGAGHVFFTLKDSESSVPCVLFAKTAARLRTRPESGMGAVVQGRVTVRSRDCGCSVQVLDLLPDGQGSASAKKEARRRKLEALGAFCTERKRPIPVLPHKIGVITGDDTAALADLTRVFGEEYPIGELLLCLVLVQGEQAPQQIAGAIACLSNRLDCQVIVCARGGGSQEDLAAFDAEVVVMAAVHASVPVIAAVGHESDWSLLDFAADFRVPTPTAAAKLFGSQLQGVRHQLAETGRRLVRRGESMLAQRCQACRAQSRMLSLLDPAKHLVQEKSRLDQCRDRLQMAARRQLTVAESNMNRLHDQFAGFSGQRQLEQRGNQIVQLQQAMSDVIEKKMIRFRSNTDRLAAGLQALGPQAVLQRGYAIVENISAPHQPVQAGNLLRIHTAQQEIVATSMQVLGRHNNGFQEDEENER